MWHSEEVAPFPVAYQFARCVSLAVCETAPEIPNSAVRYRGSPASSSQEDVNQALTSPN